MQIERETELTMTLRVKERATVSAPPTGQKESTGAARHRALPSIPTPAEAYKRIRMRMGAASLMTRTAITQGNRLRWEYDHGAKDDVVPGLLDAWHVRAINWLDAAERGDLELEATPVEAPE